MQARQANGSILSELGFQARYDQRVSYWFSSDDDDGEEDMVNALDFQPELIPTQIFQGKILLRESSVLKLYYETPATNGEADQDELLEVSEKDSAIKKINMAINLYAVFNESTDPLIRMLRTTRLDYKKHFFFGKAEVQEPTTFVASDASTTDLAPGDEIRFKTDFEEISLTWGPSDLFHIGFYQAKTKKFHESSVLSQNLMVYETEITGTGLKLIVDAENVLVDLNLGYVEFSGAQGNFKSDGGEFLFHTEWRPHIYLIGGPDSSTRSRLALIPSFGFQFNMQLGGDPEGVESDGSGEASMDIIVDASIGLMYQF